MMRKLLAAGSAAALVLAVVAPAMVLAAIPSNDDFAAATAITALPFTDTVDNTEATRETSEPAACNYTTQTVWYKITPLANGVLSADMAGSSFGDTNLAGWVQNGSGFSGLSYLACTYFGGSITFAVQSGLTYYLQASSIYSGGGSLTVNVAQVPPPPNDNFAMATKVMMLPRQESVFTLGATAELGEKFPGEVCGNGFHRGATIWYTYTAPQNQQITIDTPNSNTARDIAVYTGNAVNALTPVQGACSIWTAQTNPVVKFQAVGGTIYRIQIDALGGTTGVRITSP